MNTINFVMYTIWGIVTLDAQFLNPPPNEEVGCTGSNVYFNWTYSTSSQVFSAEWKVNGTSIATEIVQTNQAFTPSGSYVSRLTRVSNAQISLASVNPNDYGEFTCEVSYTSGLDFTSNPVTLFVYDILTGSLSISKSVAENSVTLASSIANQDTSYEWTYEGEVVGRGSTYAATKNGKYTLTLGKRGKCLSPGPSYASMDVVEISSSTTTESTFNLSTDVSTTTNSQTSSELSTDSLPYSQSSVSLFHSTDSTFSGRTETSTSAVTTSPSGLTEEMIIIISTVSAVGGILLIVIIVIVLLRCKRRSANKSEKQRNKHGKLHFNKNGSYKDLNSNHDQSQKNKHHAHSGSKIQGAADLYQKHPQNDIWYGGRMPAGVKYPRSQNYHQEKYFPRNQHHYRNQNSAYYLPYTDPRNVVYHQRYPGSRYSEDMSGYSRGGPYRMQQVYPQSYARQDRYTDDGLERRIGHGRGDYEDYWDDTLY